MIQISPSSDRWTVTGAPFWSLAGNADLSGIRLDSIGAGVQARTAVMRAGYESLQHSVQQLPTRSRPRLPRWEDYAGAQAAMSIRMDATTFAQTTNAPLNNGNPYDRVRGLDYQSLLSAIPAAPIAPGAESYNLRYRDVSGSWKVFQAGQSNQLNPYVPAVSEDAPLPILTAYADEIDNDWLTELTEANAGVNHLPATLAALQRGALEWQYTLLTTGIAGLQAHNLSTLPMTRVGTASTWSTSMTDAQIDTYTGEVIAAIAAHVIAAPMAFKPRRVFVASSLIALLAGRSNYAGGGNGGAWGMFQAKLGALGISEIVRVDWLNRITSAAHGIWIPMDELPDRAAGATERVVAMSPTMVASWTHEGRLVKRWAVRVGGLIQPTRDGALMIEVPA